MFSLELDDLKKEITGQWEGRVGREGHVRETFWKKFPYNPSKTFKEGIEALAFSTSSNSVRGRTCSVRQNSCRKLLGPPPHPLHKIRIVWINFAFHACRSWWLHGERCRTNFYIFLPNPLWRAARTGRPPRVRPGVLLGYFLGRAKK
jgi:hypothetical protein